MLEDRQYMREPSFRSGRSATMTLLIVNVVAFILECVFYNYPPRFGAQDYLPLSWYGIRHGYVWQLLTFQFLHGGLWHLLGNCFVIYMFGREVEDALGRRPFLTLYFLSGAMGGLLQGMAGGLAEQLTRGMVPSRLTEWALSFAGPTVGASAGALGLLAAYGTLYPDRSLTLLLFFVVPFTMPAKVMVMFAGALALFGIIFPADHLADAAHLGGLLTGIFFVRYAIHWQWPWTGFQRSRGSTPRLVKVSTSSAGRWSSGKTGPDQDLPADEFLSKEVDPILDKISAHGIQSLTDRERRILEAAREKMGKR